MWGSHEDDRDGVDDRAAGVAGKRGDVGGPGVIRSAFGGVRGLAADVSVWEKLFSGAVSGGASPPPLAPRADPSNRVACPLVSASVHGGLNCPVIGFGTLVTKTDYPAIYRFKAGSER